MVAPLEKFSDGAYFFGKISSGYGIADNLQFD
jgi:hypothetical protein